MWSATLIVSCKQVHNGDTPKRKVIDWSIEIYIKTKLRQLLVENNWYCLNDKAEGKIMLVWHMQGKHSVFETLSVK